MSSRIRAGFSGLLHGKGLKTELVRGGLGAGGLRLFSIVLVLAVSVLLARALGPAAYGRYAFVFALVTVLAIPIAQGLRQLTVRETSVYAHEADLAHLRGLWRWANRRVWLVAVVLGVVIGVAAAPRAAWAADDRWTLLLIGLAAVPFLGLNAVRCGGLAGLGRVVLAQLPEQIVRPFVQLTAVGLLIIAGALSPASALAAFALAALITYAIGAALLARFRPAGLAEARPVESGEWQRAWLPFTLIVAASTFNAQIGILLLGWLSTDASVAAMHIAERGAIFVALSLTIVNMVLGPYVTRAWRDGDTARLQQLSRRSARAALLVGMPIALPLILAGGPIIAVAFGEEYVAGATLPLAVLAAGHLVNVAFGSVGLLLSMSGFEKDTMTGQVVALAVNALLALALIPRYGALGAAVAAAAGLVVWNGLLALRVRQRLGIRPSAL